ncbi:MAG TPA: zinc ribbon domain-containing protein [Woeseiaceae bacterium]|nr:zinc ribbon domain-containing protein [Woeseiaceae bacterium]
MPIYEYACKKCSHTLDVLQKISDAPLVECPECGEPALRRLISAPRFRLKGAGWYETDFKKENQRNVLSSDSEPPAKEKADGKGKTEGASDKTSEPAKEKQAAKPAEKPAARAESKADSA